MFGESSRSGLFLYQTSFYPARGGQNNPLQIDGIILSPPIFTDIVQSIKTRKNFFDQLKKNQKKQFEIHTHIYQSSICSQKKS